MVPTYCIQRYTAYLFQHSIMVKNAFPLQTGLANTVIDDPLGKTQETRVDQILEYLLTDTVWLVYNLLKLVTKKKTFEIRGRFYNILIFSFLSEEPELLTLQRKEWGALWKWFNKRYVHVL